MPAFKNAIAEAALMEPADSPRTLSAWCRVKGTSMSFNGAFCTISTSWDLSRVMALHESLREKMPGTRLYVLVTNELPERISIPFNLIVLKSSEVRVSSLGTALRRRYVGDSDYTRRVLKPTLMHHLLSARGEQRVVFIEPHSFVVGEIEDLIADLQACSFGLLPMTGNRARDLLSIYGDMSSKEAVSSTYSDTVQENLLKGSFSAGLVTASCNSCHILRWWEECILHACWDGREKGYFYEQRYLDLVPARFEEATVLKNYRAVSAENGEMLGLLKGDKAVLASVEGIDPEMLEHPGPDGAGALESLITVNRKWSIHCGTCWTPRSTIETSPLFQPRAVSVFNLQETVTDLAVSSPAQRARVFLSSGEGVLTHFETDVREEKIPAPDIETGAVTFLGPDWRERIRTGEANPFPASKPHLVSVVIPSQGKRAMLKECIASVLAQEVDFDVETVIVDNDPESGRVRSLVSGITGVRIIEERKPGSSQARNAGLHAAKGEIVVFIDDDAVAHSNWLQNIVKPFADSAIAAVCGNVLPKELDTRAQLMFEDVRPGGLGRGYSPRRFEPGMVARLCRSIPIWRIAGAANCAVHPARLREKFIDGFDIRLGAGHLIGGGEDFAFYYEILRAGYSVYYQPSAAVWHQHRREMEVFAGQLMGYTRGAGCFFTWMFFKEGGRRPLRQWLAGLRWWYIRLIAESWKRKTPVPFKLALLELYGYLTSPLAFLWMCLKHLRLK